MDIKMNAKTNDIAELSRTVANGVKNACGEKDAFRLSDKKGVHLTANKKKKTLDVSVRIDVRLGTNIPQTAWDIQKAVEKELKPKLIPGKEGGLKLGKINVTIENVN
jgi:uncharacterized alkaline shock family protein YloU